LHTWQEGAAPHIIIQKNSELTLDLLQWCHPDVCFCPETETIHGKTLHYDALIGAANTTQEKLSTVPLLLSAGMEGFWCHKNLESHFFTHTQLYAQCIPDNLSEESPL
ncbi:MAG: hypothetical protein RRY29_01515, partial [Desulfovibrionaceae bacterium]